MMYMQKPLKPTARRASWRFKCREKLPGKQTKFFLRIFEKFE